MRIREALSADVDVVRDLSNRTKIRLLAFLDQNEGEMRLFLPSGEEIAKRKNMILPWR